MASTQRSYRFTVFALSFAWIVVSSRVQAQPLGAAFTYQGQLTNASVPANGAFDFEFKLFDAASGGSQVGSTWTVQDLTVTAGLFTTKLDFGATAFAGNARFLEIGVRPGVSTGAFTLLGARQEMTPGPNSLFAATAAIATTAATATVAGGVSGVVAIANGGTGSSTKSFVDLTTNQTVGGDKSLAGNLGLVASTSSSGNILKGANRFLHNFGVANTFIGENAGNFTMTGFRNSGTGVLALQSNTTGNDNTANGVLALSSNTTGGVNAAIGYNALASNTTGNGNTASGASALQSNVTGSFNIGIGFGAGANVTVGSNNIYIGTAGNADESATIRIGGPQTSVFFAGIAGITVGAGVPVLIGANNQLGTIQSARRYKDDITDMDEASSSLMKLRPVTFHYKADRAPEGPTLQYGLIAEEVAEVDPGLVVRSADGQIQTVLYQFLPPMLLNEVQKQQRTIAAQAAEIASLKQQMARLAERFDQDSARLSR